MGTRVPGGVSHFIAKGDASTRGAPRIAPKVRHTPNGRVSFHLVSSSMLYKFSSTSSIRTHAHQLLNTGQSKGFEDFKQLVLHAVLHDLICCSLACAPRRVLAHEARHG
jgi:hypothetical protein